MEQMREELRELRKDLNRQIKAIDKELRHLKRTMDVESVKESQHSVITIGKEDTKAKRIIQTKLNLLRKVVNNLQSK